MTVETEQPADIDDLRKEIDRLDAEILAAVKRRAEVSRAIGKARMASGGTRLVHSREMKVIERYSELGPRGQGPGHAAAQAGSRPARSLIRPVSRPFTSASARARST